MKKYLVTLTDEERSILNATIAKRSEKAPAVKRAYALLAADANGPNLTDQQISERYHITVRSVERLRQRFVEVGFTATLEGQTNYVAPPKVHDGRVEAELLALRCADPPEGHKQWTLRLLARQMVALEYTPHMSHESARQLLKKKSAQALAGQGMDYSEGRSGLCLRHGRRSERL